MVEIRMQNEDSRAEHKCNVLLPFPTLHSFAWLTLHAQRMVRQDSKQLKRILPHPMPKSMALAFVAS